MPVSIEVNKAVLEAFKAKLKVAREGLRNDGPGMQRVAVFLDQWVQRNIQTSGASVGGWLPFKYGGRLTTKAKGSAKSIDGRRWINTNAKLLMDTGKLRLSFLPFIRRGVAGIGSELPYSKAHDEGSDKVPQRRILPKTSEVEVQVFEILENFVLFQIRR